MTEQYYGYLVVGIIVAIMLLVAVAGYNFP
jgi:hypothetical protein